MTRPMTSEDRDLYVDVVGFVIALLDDDHDAMVRIGKGRGGHAVTDFAGLALEVLRLAIDAAGTDRDAMRSWLSELGASY